MDFPVDLHSQVDRGLFKVRGKTGESCQCLEGLVGATNASLTLTGVKKSVLVLG